MEKLIHKFQHKRCENCFGQYSHTAQHIHLTNKKKTQRCKLEFCEHANVHKKKEVNNNNYRKWNNMWTAQKLKQENSFWWLVVEKAIYAISITQIHILHMKNKFYTRKFTNTRQLIWTTISYMATTKFQHIFYFYIILCVW